MRNWLLVIGLLLPLALFSQKKNARKELGRYPEGYILTLAGDTIEGFMRLGNDFKDQRRIRFVDNYAVKAKYTADRLKGYGYGDRHFVSRPMPYFYAGLFSDTVIFMRRLVDGPAKLYRFYTRQTIFTLKQGSAFFEYFEKPDGTVHEISLTFRWKRLADAIPEYPELASDIRNDRYKPEQTVEIVQAYNKWYEEQGLSTED